MLLRIIGMMPSADWRTRTRLADDRTKEVQIVRAPGAATTLFVFSGPRGHINLPFEHFDALLSRYRANVVYLRDWTYRDFMNGIASLGPTLSESAARLRSLADDLGGPRVVTLGPSIGGYAAIRYGARLGAEAVLSLAGPTTLERDFFADFTGKSDVFGTILHNRPNSSDGNTDIVPDILSSPSMKVVKVYGASSAIDLAWTRRLKGLPNVILRKVQNADEHIILLRCIAENRLDELLTRDLGLRLASAADAPAPSR